MGALFACLDLNPSVTYICNLYIVCNIYSWLFSSINFLIPNRNIFLGEKTGTMLHSCASVTQPHTATHTQPHTHSHTHTQPHSHTATHTQPHSHTHTHTHTHTMHTFGGAGHLRQVYLKVSVSSASGLLDTHLPSVLLTAVTNNNK